MPKIKEEVKHRSSPYKSSQQLNNSESSNKDNNEEKNSETDGSEENITKEDNNNKENSNKMTIPASELLKEASRIKEFSGNNDYDLSSFIREVELVLPLFNDNQLMKEFVFKRYVLPRIQGEALRVIRTLSSDSDWEAIKTELIRNFGVKESYHSLYHQAINLRNYNVSEYFSKLKRILDKLNIKYEFDSSKPVEFSPDSNESVILKTFLNGINPNLASIIHSRQITKLRDAYFTLQDTGMLRSYDNRNSSHRNFQNRNNSRSDNSMLPFDNFQSRNTGYQEYNNNNNYNNRCHKP